MFMIMRNRELYPCFQDYLRQIRFKNKTAILCLTGRRMAAVQEMLRLSPDSGWQAQLTPLYSHSMVAGGLPETS